MFATKDQIQAKFLNCSSLFPSCFFLQLNGLLINLPYNIEYYKVALYHQGWNVVIKTDFGLTLTFDGQNNIQLRVPGTYRNALCGLCGNFNGQSDDDMTQKNRAVASSPGNFGRSWKLRDIPGCEEVETEDCKDMVNVERMQKKGKECGILLDKNGPFKDCHTKIPPTWHFKDCVFDYCSNKGNTKVMCHIISSYAAACQAAGARVYEWRSTSFCSKFIVKRFRPKLHQNKCHLNGGRNAFFTQVKC